MSRFTKPVVSVTAAGLAGLALASFIDMFLHLISTGPGRVVLVWFVFWSLLSLYLIWRDARAAGQGGV